MFRLDVTEFAWQKLGERYINIKFEEILDQARMKSIVASYVRLYHTAYIARIMKGCEAIDARCATQKDVDKLLSIWQER